MNTQNNCTSNGHPMPGHTGQQGNSKMNIFQKIKRSWGSLMIDLPLSTYVSRRRSINARPSFEEENGKKPETDCVYKYSISSGMFLMFIIPWAKKNGKIQVEFLGDERNPGTREKVAEFARGVREYYFPELRLEDIHWAYFDFHFRTRDVNREVLFGEAAPVSEGCDWL